MKLEDEFYTTEELAALLKVKPATIRMWRHQGKGPKYFKLGRVARYVKADIQAWLRIRGV